eukprot:360488-Chlamydomonas_euryale.AAC.12
MTLKCSYSDRTDLHPRPLSVVVMPTFLWKGEGPAHSAALKVRLSCSLTRRVATLWVRKQGCQVGGGEGSVHTHTRISDASMTHCRAGQAWATSQPMPGAPVTVAPECSYGSPSCMQELSWQSATDLRQGLGQLELVGGGAQCWLYLVAGQALNFIHQAVAAPGYGFCEGWVVLLF